MLLRVLFFSLLLALAGCQTGKKGFDHGFDRSDASFAHHDLHRMEILDSYDAIRRAFKNGHIMQARASVLAMDASHADYQKAQRLLKKEIEPARKRIFAHYLHTAEKLEKSQLWSEAMWAYDQASVVSIEPAAMEQKRDEMGQRLRQLRFERLLQQRRLEDQALLQGAAAYQPPKGVHASDKVYAYLRERYNDQMDARADQAFEEARAFLREGVPEIAYIEAESLLRFRPDSQQGQKLMQAINSAIPKYIQIPAMDAAGEHKVAHANKKRRSSHPKHVTKKQVLDALHAGELLKAKQLVYIYRRNGGKGAQKLLNQVWRQVNAQAASYFAMGSSAFREEQLDRAIQYWSKAARLRPDHSEYVDSLRRAKQLKERLQLLREKSQ